jgi:hypothetical protein
MRYRFPNKVNLSNRFHVTDRTAETDVDCMKGMMMLGMLQKA